MANKYITFHFDAGSKSKFNRNVMTDISLATFLTRFWYFLLREPFFFLLIPLHGGAREPNSKFVHESTVFFSNFIENLI